MIKINMPSDNKCSCSNNRDNSCCPPVEMIYSYEESWITGSILTPVGAVQQISTNLEFADIMGSWKARWGINRMNYIIQAGIYCVGNPDHTSSVLVTANYKMSFDLLRKELSGLNIWVLVLDTKGINVWCAAGKGTFGTDELINRIDKVQLSLLVSHRNIILPQLAAPGIIAHEVKKHSGFKISYGPIRADDIKIFIENEMRANPEMRTVKFPFIDRLVLTPIELTAAFKPTLIIFGVFFILNAIGLGNFSFIDLYAFLGAIFIGTILTPLLLPWIPGRAFSFKGWTLGLIWSLAVNFINGWPLEPSYGWLIAVAYIFILPAISAYLAMNFTGCSTYTSVSGVKKEMRIALPLLLISLSAGIILIITDMLLKLFA